MMNEGATTFGQYTKTGITILFLMVQIKIELVVPDLVVSTEQFMLDGWMDGGRHNQFVIYPADLGCKIDFRDFQ